MDRLGEFLVAVSHLGRQGDFLGLLNILIGRTVAKQDGTHVSRGLTWRETASLLKKVRWRQETCIELGMDPGQLPPRDRARFWYLVISRAGIDSPQAQQAGNDLAARLRSAGYVIGPTPTKDEG
jgi:hypothetical protein